MRLLALCFLLALPLVAFAQNADVSDTCSSCQKLFVLTPQALYLVANNSAIVCQSGFAKATDFAVDQSTGNMWVADEGARSLVFVDFNCTNKTTVLQNNELQWSFLSPRGLAFDSLSRVIYVSMGDIDPLWSTYNMPRRLLARERHVYRWNVNNDNTLGSGFDILAKGADNGRGIDTLRVFDGQLMGVRKNKYITQLIDDVWVDYLGPQNEFLMAENYVSISSVDRNFQKCGYLAASLREDNQFMICNNDTAVSSCKNRCPGETLYNKLFGDSFSTGNNTNSNSGSNLDVLPFIDSNAQFNIQEGVLSQDIGANISTSLLTNCDELILPTSVFIDCSCNLFVAARSASGDSGKLFKYIVNGENAGTGNDITFSDFGTYTPFVLPISKIDVYNYADCNATPQPTQATPIPTPEPTQATPIPTPEPTQATPIPTPEPTQTAQPTPQPTATAIPTPEPTQATSQPTAAPAFFKRLHRLI